MSHAEFGRLDASQHTVYLKFNLTEHHVFFVVNRRCFSVVGGNSPMAFHYRGKQAKINFRHGNAKLWPSGLDSDFISYNNIQNTKLENPQWPSCSACQHRTHFLPQGIAVWYPLLQKFIQIAHHQRVPPNCFIPKLAWIIHFPAPHPHFTFGYLSSFDVQFCFRFTHKQ